MGLLQLEFTSETLVLAVLADSGAAASDDLALDLASSTGRARLFEPIWTRGGGGGSSARGGAGVATVLVSVASMTVYKQRTTYTAAGLPRRSSASTSGASNMSRSGVVSAAVVKVLLS